MDDMGFIFYPRDDPQSIGYSRLDVTLRSRPTEKHFDPEEFRLRVASEGGGIEYLYVNHPWVGEEQYRVCVGHLAFRDRKNKFINAYTFGGDLRIETNKDKNKCVLVSSAPCFRFEGTNTISNLIAQETDILLAKIAPEIRSDNMNYEQKISSIEPLLLYGAFLVSIESLYRDFEYPKHDYILNLMHFIKHEKDRLKVTGALLFPIPELVDLLQE